MVASCLIINKCFVDPGFATRRRQSSPACVLVKVLNDPTYCYLKHFFEIVFQQIILRRTVPASERSATRGTFILMALKVFTIHERH